MQRTPQAPGWFRQTVADALTRMYALNLEGCPGADVLEGTTAVWVEDIWACVVHSAPTAEQDQDRFVAAFRELRLSAKRWPSPAALLEKLRPREQKRPLALPRGDIGEEERARRILENARRQAEMQRHQ